MNDPLSDAGGNSSERRAEELALHVAMPDLAAILCMAALKLLDLQRQSAQYLIVS